MKVTKLIGKKVLDVDANLIGKVSDIDIDVDSFSIEKIILNSGEISLRKVSYEITPDDVAKIGDYLILKIDKTELLSKNEEYDVKIVDPSELEEKSKKEE